jgi:hypothetical protein
MISVPKIWPVAVAVLGVFLFIAGQAYRSGYLVGMAFILFTFILTAMHNRHWEPMKYRGQLIGYLVALAGLVMATLGYWQSALDPGSSAAADQAIQIYASPGQFILLPLGMILFGGDDRIVIRIVGKEAGNIPAEPTF